MEISCKSGSGNMLKNINEIMMLNMQIFLCLDKSVTCVDGNKGSLIKFVLFEVEELPWSILVANYIENTVCRYI